MSEIPERNQKILDFIKKNVEDDPFSYFAGTPKKGEYISYARYGCYAPLKNLKMVDLGIGYPCDKNDKVGMTYLAWLLSEESPWRSIIKNDVTLIEDKERVYGLYFGPKALESKPNHLMNFFITSRAWTEFKDHIIFWHFCVENGMTGAEAYIYCRDFVLDEDDIYKKTVSALSHWSINRNLNFKKFVNSEPDPKITTIDNIFAGPEKTSFSFLAGHGWGAGYGTNSVFDKYPKKMDKKSFLTASKSTLSTQPFTYK